MTALYVWYFVARNAAFEEFLYHALLVCLVQILETVEQDDKHSEIVSVGILNFSWICVTSSWREKGDFILYIKLK